MGARYRANIDITVNGTKFLAGAEIRESIFPRDAEFLLREKYIEKISARSEKEEKSEIKNPEAAKPESKKKDENSEQAAQKGKNPRK